MTRRVLVAGIGNIFLGDDGWGVEVATRLVREALPAGVRVTDFGIRGVHLAYELLEGYDALVLIDAMPMGERPGTVAVLEPDPPARPATGDDPAPLFDAHGMNAGVVLAHLAGLGGVVEKIFVVGCEPATLEEGIGLSSPVAAAVDGAVELCRQLAADLMEPAAKETTS
jgi:hydrogenase maturation protease